MQFELNFDGGGGQPPLSILKKKFQKFHMENPHVYELFKKFTFQVIDRPRQHYSVSIIIERIRWETDIETNDKKFKISNNHRAYYGRLFEKDFPEHLGFFRKKPVPGDELKPVPGAGDHER